MSSRLEAPSVAVGGLLQCLAVEELLARERLVTILRAAAGGSPRVCLDC